MRDASGPVHVLLILGKGKHKEGGGLNVLAFASELQTESGIKPRISAFLFGLLPHKAEILAT